MLNHKPIESNNMNNEITVNDHKATLESFFTDVAWIQTPKLQSFCRDMFKRHESNIVESDWFSTGGGCYHLLFRLSDGHIIAMHADSNVCEQSFHPWESIEDYLQASNIDYEGFGWEHESPDYDQRCQTMA